MTCCKWSKTFRFTDIVHFSVGFLFLTLRSTVRNDVEISNSNEGGEMLVSAPPTPY